MCQPCPSSSLTQGTVPFTLKPSVVGRGDQGWGPGFQQKPKSHCNGQSGYLLLFRGSPTEPRVLLHKAGILVLGFSQLQFLRDRGSFGEGARRPHTSSPHTEDLALPDKAFLPHLDPVPGRAEEPRRTGGAKAEVRGSPPPGWTPGGPWELTSSSHLLCFFRASCSRLSHFFRFLLSSDSCGVRTKGSSCGKADLPTTGCLEPLTWDLPAAAPSAVSQAPLGQPVGSPHPPGAWPGNAQGWGLAPENRAPGQPAPLSGLCVAGSHPISQSAKPSLLQKGE